MSAELMTPVQALECTKLARKVLIICGYPSGEGNIETEGIIPGRDDPRFGELQPFQLHPNATFLELAVANVPTPEGEFIYPWRTMNGEDLSNVPHSNVEISYWDIQDPERPVGKDNPGAKYYHVSFEGQHYKSHYWKFPVKTVVAPNREAIDPYIDTLLEDYGLVHTHINSETGEAVAQVLQQCVEREGITVPEADLLIADLDMIVAAAK